jgi:hypothetical protein
MEDTDVNKYRKAAAFLKNTVLENLRNYAETLSVPVIGDAYNFPRPTAAARIINLKISLLKGQINDGIATLNTFAAIKEIETNGLQVSPLLKGLMEREKEKAQFYLNFFDKFNILKITAEYDQKQEGDQPVKKKAKKQVTGSKKRSKSN